MEGVEHRPLSDECPDGLGDKLLFIEKCVRRFCALRANPTRDDLVRRQWRAISWLGDLLSDADALTEYVRFSLKARRFVCRRRFVADDRPVRLGGTRGFELSLVEETGDLLLVAEIRLWVASETGPSVGKRDVTVHHYRSGAWVQQVLDLHAEMLQTINDRWKSVVAWRLAVSLRD